jgi:hypothetical protein
MAILVLLMRQPTVMGLDLLFIGGGQIERNPAKFSCQRRRAQNQTMTAAYGSSP